VTFWVPVTVSLPDKPGARTTLKVKVSHDVWWLEEWPSYLCPDQLNQGLYAHSGRRFLIERQGVVGPNQAAIQ